MEDEIVLHFDPTLSINPDGKHVRDGLSTVLRTGDNLWLSCDERTHIERLKLMPDGTFGEHFSFNVRDYLSLPGEGEIDIEGMGADNNYLWIIGSHSLKRKKPRQHDSFPDQAKRLSKVKADPNRYLLARIPMVQDQETGDYTLFRECPDPANPGHMLRAAQLNGDEKGNLLTEALQHDEHIASFLPIPGKDNGFDIEGIAVGGNTLYVGLRGPVLRGWAIVLELETEEEAEGILKLKQLTKQRPYKKHFLQLRGKGIRELRVFKNDIYVLAGPTMDLDGVIAVYRWRNAVGVTEETLVHNHELERLCEVPHGFGEESGKDKAEGLAIFDEQRLLVVFDSPRDARKKETDSVVADLVKVLPQ
ncbi:DUF3616 domain-containing protein [Pontibacter harenae]|uniref:DUF3616 domain-containing protein n=1 Tax=Pontibacter harenae TaxID=2894083 RepID=UPI001E478E95|nr:DUF3616 domain-containing protein [Pontibacter harenae]MCC9168031.1 DUF3616 domain-containing protein [Pontibacter harenae]